MGENEVGDRGGVRTAGEAGTGMGVGKAGDGDTVTGRLDTWKTDGTGIRRGIRMGRKVETE